MPHRARSHVSAREQARRKARAERRRWRRHKFVLVIAAVPFIIGGLVTAAVAVPPTHGPVPPVAAPTASPVTAPAPNPDCTLTVPAVPLTARGLATPYTLSATNPAHGPCHEANPAQTAFVQATIYNPATGALSVYDPLVVDAGRRPAATPNVPALPAGAVVGIWFGYNGDNLTLRASGAGLALNRCVNGLGTSVFGQFAYCNAATFFTAVKGGIAARKVTVPALGTANDGKPCPTTRDFSIIDQDQSDNVTTQYLVTAGGATAQNTSANVARLPGAAVLSNPSDNALLDNFIDPALGCAAWSVRDLAGGGTSTSLALDEIQANTFQAAPAALVPLNDPMATVSGNYSAPKANLYRTGVDQAVLPSGQSPKLYCQDMDSVQSARLELDLNRFANAASPDPAAATSLLTFLGDRLNASFQNLGCARFGLTDPVSSETTDDAGAVSAVTFVH